MKKFEVLLSEGSARFLKELPGFEEERIKERLHALEEDPYTPRPCADIRKMSAFKNPELYRMRIGDYRAIYSIAGKQVFVTEIMRRGKGYCWLD